MDDRLSRLESRVEQLAHALADLDDRLSAVEQATHPGVTISRPATSPTEPSAVPPAPGESDFAVALSLIGRTLLALGGAYLLRAITEAGALPQLVGVSIGFAYAFAWIYFAERAGAGGKTASAAFHAGAATLIGYPIIWETTVQLQLIAPLASAALVLAFSLALLTVVCRWRLTSTAWVAQVAVMVTAFALMAGTRAVAPFAAVLVTEGVATLWLGYHRAWPSLQWFSAAVADVAVQLVTFGAIAQNQAIPASTALPVQLSLFLGYFASFYYRTLARRRSVNPFEILQASAVTVVGLGGSLAVADTPLTRTVVGLLGVGVAVVSLWRALREWKQPEPGWSGALFSSLAIASLLLSTSTSIPGPAYLWASLGLIAFVFGNRVGRILLSLDGGILLLASSLASGLLARAAYAFGAPASVPWPRFSLAELAVVAAALASCLAIVPDAPSWTVWRQMPKALALLAPVAACGTAAMYLLSPFIAGVPGGVIDPARLAALRTAILALSAVALGALAGRKGLREALWLLYPLLIVTAIKLLLEDFPRGRADTLFVALACYGCALIVAPRLARSSG